MNRVGSITSPGELSESQKAALLTLLADDDPNVYRKIRQKIISFGPSASEWLRPHTLSREPALRRRAQLQPLGRSGRGQGDLYHQRDQRKIEVAVAGL